MILTVTVAMSACSPRERGFYDLYDEYENGNITLKETRKIAKYFSLQTGVHIKERFELENIGPETGSEYEWREIELEEGLKAPELSAKKISEIKEAIYVNWEDDFKRAAEYDSNESASKEEQIEKYLEFEYCGTYHGGIALAINIKIGWGFNCSDNRGLTSDLIYNSFHCDRLFYLYYR